MRRINLLPADERGRPADRLRSGVVGILLVVGAFVLIVMVGVYLVLLLRLGDLEDQVAQLDAEIARQNAALAELSPYRDLKARLEAKKPVADGIFRSRFAWDQFLQGLAFVVPESTALDTFTAEAAPIDLDAPVEQPLDPPGTITLRECGRLRRAHGQPPVSRQRGSRVSHRAIELTSLPCELRSRLGTGHAGRG